jgi:hypothetical protein
MTRRPQIDVHIDELVLHGFQPGDRRAIADAIEREVTRTVAASAVGAFHDRRVARIDGGRVDWTPRGGATRIGAAVARAIGGRIAP